ncbi:unnamed protein product [Diatraea saccharalis]|uniref:Ig-like domain-containing protein n=1 Tax=Diatraea saccharalis TaxID=40085 RepID=A0A9N9WCB9_9NEOP|nr:unnamed protein product [Diatraea saccharalis]
MSHFLAVTICLRVVGVTVPTFKQRGEAATLGCDFDLEGGKLYSVKWYRDHEEFYRYMPKLRPPQHAHKVDGIKVDMDKSTARRVHLKDLSLKSRGVYRCEVSKEAPSFHSAQAEAFMEVYYFPRESPRISGHERTYSPGEPLDVNCSARSFPPPELQWHIDGEKVCLLIELWHDFFLHLLLRDFHSLVSERAWLISYGVKSTPQGLLVSTLGLRAPAHPLMRLSCIASMGTLQRERTVILG